MASSSKRHGAVKTVEWWNHLRFRKKAQERIVRADAKHQIQQQLEEDYDDPADALSDYLANQYKKRGLDPGPDA